MTAKKTVRCGDASRGAVAALVAMSGAAADPGDDLELCVADFARFGFTGLEALGELLAIRAGVPIAISTRKPAGKADPSAVRCMVRRPGNSDEFRVTVQRLRRTGGAMYLRLEI